MPRKRREGLTTPFRYTYKAIRAHGGVPDPAILNQLGHMQEAARQAGVSPFRTAWEEAKAVLLRQGVPSGLHGLYRAYTLELVSKVQMRGILTVDELIPMVERKMGLDPSILQSIAEEIGVLTPKETVKSTPSVT